jgi:hypothetical protein
MAGRQGVVVSKASREDTHRVSLLKPAGGLPVLLAQRSLQKMIRRFAPLLLLLAGLALPVLAQQTAASPTPATAAQPAPPRTHLKVGQPAPDFTLTDTEGKQVNLHDFKGTKNVVLAFYVLAFTGG